MYWILLLPKNLGFTETDYVSLGIVVAFHIVSLSLDLAQYSRYGLL